MTPDSRPGVLPHIRFRSMPLCLQVPTSNPKRLIAGRNKAFLEVGGKKLVRYVVDALLDAESIDQIFVVGPAEELLKVLAGYSRKVRVIAQRGKMLTNCWAGIEASEDLHRYDTAIPLNQRPILIISCDLPLVTARSIDDFIGRCARQDNASVEQPFAMLAGVVDEPWCQAIPSRRGQAGYQASVCGT